MIDKIKPGPGQESVWDYPRPPRIEPFNGSIRIIFNNEEILNTNRSYRILETSHPPTYYLPISAFKSGVLNETVGSSFCEFKGMASYFDIQVGEKVARKSAWYYPEPSIRFKDLKDHVCLYASPMDACLINDEKVIPQPGGFYGGWITSNVVGPFKGGEGTWGW
jgi:uncharacterized protein (DUF427 family)